MPIKFRCQHCRQFLGISRAMAGGVVDCPTCGHTIRVPHLDGRVDPLPEPKLNLKDSTLSRALDELARIAAAPIPDDIRPPAPPAAELDEGPLQPLPVPEPIVLEPPLPAVPVDPSVERGDSAGRPNTSSVARPSEARARHGVPDQMEFVYVPHAPAVAADQPHVVSPWSLLGERTVQAVLLATAVVMFAAGLFAGRMWPESHSPAADATNRVSASANGGETASLPTGNGAARSPISIRGRITYKTADGESRPDAGARILILPSQRRGEAKLSVVGFRAGDSPEDVRLAQAAVQALGGALAVADDAGDFHVPLNTAGTYQVLVVSNYQPRPADAPLDDDARGALAVYFEQPQQLLGRVAWHFSPLRVSTSATQVWDHSFDAGL